MPCPLPDSLERGGARSAFGGRAAAGRCMAVMAAWGGELIIRSENRFVSAGYYRIQGKIDILRRGLGLDQGLARDRDSVHICRMKGGGNP